MSDMDAWQRYLLDASQPTPPLIGQGHIWPRAERARISCVACGVTVYFNADGDLVIPATVHEPCPGDPE